MPVLYRQDKPSLAVFIVIKFG